jgi:hypothetical protein
VSGRMHSRKTKISIGRPLQPGRVLKKVRSAISPTQQGSMAMTVKRPLAGGAYTGERPFGRAANRPSTRPRKPTDEDMGPHNWGGGEARPKGGAGRRRRRG